MNSLRHVAVIMDGNGRWGLRKNKSRNYGHRVGMNTVEKILEKLKQDKDGKLVNFPTAPTE